MKKIIAIQSDDIKKVNIKTDTSVLLAKEAQLRGYKIIWYETKDLNFINSKVFVYGKEIKFFNNKVKFYKIIKNIKFDISTAQYILIRQNPPFDTNYINSTYYLDIIKRSKIINNPTSIRNISEKFYSTKFIKYMPPTIFTKNLFEIKNFLKKHKNIVIKPINGYAGKNILFIKKNINKKNILKYLNKFDHVMVQKYLPSIKYGDKRVFIINGKVRGAIKRIPKKGSNLANISQGGKAFETKLNKKELRMSKAVAKSLSKNKIFFAGIDLINGYLIGDINVTSPTGLPQYKELTGINLAKDFWNEAKRLK
tara:strand:- start:45 stop:974 length:930 start_codon:yes stop_codon:yes gene_type:complete